MFEEKFDYVYGSTKTQNMLIMRGYSVITCFTISKLKIIVY